MPVLESSPIQCGVELRSSTIRSLPVAVLFCHLDA